MKYPYFFFPQLLLLFLCSCTVGPNYRQPDLNSGSGWSMNSLHAEPTELGAWWRRFEDPVLNQLVERAELQNLDIRQAIARIDEVRALYSLTSALDKPAAEAQASVTRRRQSENGPLPVNRIPGLERDQTIYDLGFDAIWEIDLFGGNRRAVEAATARLQETVENRRDIQLTIIAEVVRRYVELCANQREMAVRKKIVESSQQTYDLVKFQFEAGEVTDAEVALAYTELAAQQAKLPEVEAEIRVAALALGLLVGDLPESTLDLLNQQPPALHLEAIPVGTRADILRRRPDIRAAERKLAAATADIGAVTAELFPKLSLNAAGGFEALSPGNLLQSASQTWRVAPLISWRIFDSGRIKAQIKASEAIAARHALAYEKTVLSALAEAEQALARYHYSLESLHLQQDSLQAAQHSQLFAENRYSAGDISLFELLEAQQNVYRAETGFTQMHRRSAVNLVSLYKTLGGGWHNAPVAAAR